MSFNPPTSCPACNSDLVWRKDQLYCENSSCDARQEKQVEHFAKTLKIKGLGPATIKTLGFASIHEIYFDDLSKISSEKVREKLIAEIEKSKQKSLNEVLPALGIPLIGQSATNKLSEVCDSIFDINTETCRQAGLGPKATNNLLDWLAINLDDLLQLPFDFLFKKTELERGVICITGKLKSYRTKAEAKEVLESKGWKVVDAVTKEVTHLLNESNKPSAKTQKADSLKIEIVSNINDVL